MLTTSLHNVSMSCLHPSLFSLGPVSSSLAQSVMSMASSQSQHSEISTDTMSSMSGSYVAPGTEEEGDMAPSPGIGSRIPSEEDVSMAKPFRVPYSTNCGVLQITYSVSVSLEEAFRYYIPGQFKCFKILVTL